MTTRHCDIKNRLGYLCSANARFQVYWQSTGDDSLHSCNQHLARAVTEVLKPSHVSSWGVAKVRELPV